MLHFIKTYLLELLFPIACLGCEAEGAYLCPRCRKSLARTPPSCVVCKRLSPRTCQSCRQKTPISGFFSPYQYDSPLIRDLIHGLKYKRIRPLGGVLAELLAAYLAMYGIGFSGNVWLIPIPLHERRRRVRGFNQSEEIARLLGAHLEIKVRTDVLYKIKTTVPQVKLARGRRLHNVSEAFLVQYPELLQGRTIILLDDVKTTGATLREAAYMLKKAGADRIWAVTVAH